MNEEKHDKSSYYKKYRDEIKGGDKEKMKEYDRLRVKEYQKTSKYKDYKKDYMEKYNKLEKGKKYLENYQKSEKFKKSQKDYRDRNKLKLKCLICDVSFGSPSEMKRHMGTKKHKK